jgi:hypothetical protein
VYFRLRLLRELLLELGARLEDGLDVLRVRQAPLLLDERL